MSAFIGTKAIKGFCSGAEPKPEAKSAPKPDKKAPGWLWRKLGLDKPGHNPKDPTP